jgi:hypothetical protein
MGGSFFHFLYLVALAPSKDLFICAKDLFVEAFSPSLEDCHGVPNSRWPLGSVAFHYPVKLALDFVQAAEDQGEAVVGVGHGTHRKERPQPPLLARASIGCGRTRKTHSTPISF